MMAVVEQRYGQVHKVHLVDGVISEALDLMASLLTQPEEDWVLYRDGLDQAWCEYVGSEAEDRGDYFESGRRYQQLNLTLVGSDLIETYPRRGDIRVVVAL